MTYYVHVHMAPEHEMTGFFILVTNRGPILLVFSDEEKATSYAALAATMAGHAVFQLPIEAQSRDDLARSLSKRSQLAPGDASLVFDTDPRCDQVLSSLVASSG